MCKIKHDMEYIPEKGVSVMGHQVFISYSTKDTTQAEWVRKILENNGITCWIAPRNIPGGSNYAREIPPAIRECQVFVLMLSRNSESSIWVSKELDLAVNCRKVIIPMMLEDFIIGDEFNFLLTGAQRYAAYERKSEVMELLVKRVRSIAMLDDEKVSLPEESYEEQEPEEDWWESFLGGQDMVDEAEEPTVSVNEPVLTHEPRFPQVWSRECKHPFPIDGIYVCQEEDAYRYLWFQKKEDGIFWANEVVSACEPNMEMYERMHFWKTIGKAGKCWFNGFSIHFYTNEFAWDKQKQPIYDGMIKKDGVFLSCFNPATDQLKNYHYQFMPFPKETASSESKVEPEFTGMQKLLRKTPQLRFDGYYCLDRGEAGRTYLRFYSKKDYDGTLFVEEYFCTGQEDVRTVFRTKKDTPFIKKELGSFQRSHDDIQMKFPFCDTAYTIYRGKIRENSLELITWHCEVDRYYREKYTFVKADYLDNEFPNDM